MAKMPRERLIGLANQDQLIASIRAVWEQTDPDMLMELLSWTESCDMDSVRSFFAELPDEWVQFVQNAVICGLREMLHRSVEKPT